MGLLKITTPAGIRATGQVYADDLENVFGQVYTFLSTAAWVEAVNVRPQGIDGTSVADSAITGIATADDTLPTRVLADGAVGAPQIAGANICEYHLNRDSTSDALIKVHSTYYPLNMKRVLYGPLTLATTDYSTGVDLATILAQTGMEGAATIITRTSVTCTIINASSNEYTYCKKGNFVMFYRSNALGTAITFTFEVVILGY